MGLFDFFLKKSNQKRGAFPPKEAGLEKVNFPVPITNEGISDYPEDDKLIDILKLQDSGIEQLKEYYVLDVETTGLNRKIDKIIEIAWIKVKDGSVAVSSPNC